MSLMDFFRKIFSSEKEEKKEEVKFSELGSWLKKRKEELKEKEKQVLNSIKSKLAELISELEEEIRVLERINVDERKVEDKLKFIVKENLFLYIKHLKKHVETIKNLPDKNFITSLNSCFLEFSRKSEKNFQKATILIGNELGDVKESISRFFKDSKLIIEENKDCFNQLKTIKEIENKLESIFDIKGAKQEIKNNLSELDLKIRDKTDAIGTLENEIERIKKTEKYSENIRKKERNEREKEELKKEANELRDLINFKNLARILHMNEKKMRIIKEYNENFLSAVESDKGERLIGILKEVNYLLEIEEKINSIIKRQEEIKNFKEENEVRDIETKIKKIKSELGTLKNEKLREEKTIERQDEAEENIISEIKKELEKINFHLST